MFTHVAAHSYSGALKTGWRRLTQRPLAHDARRASTRAPSATPIIVAAGLCLLVSASAVALPVPPHAVELFTYEFEPEQIHDAVVANVIDSTGWFNATMVGDPTPVPADTGQALAFDGIDDLLRVEASDHVTFRNGLAVEARVWIPDGAMRDRGAGIVSKWYPDQWGLGLGMGYGAHGKVDFFIRLDDGTWQGEYQSIDYYFPDDNHLNTWVKLGAVYEPGVGMRLYVDDVLVAEKSTNPYPIIDSSNIIRVGDSGTEWSRFEGKIDRVQVWGDFSPDPPAAGVLLVDYGFDEGELSDGEVHNGVVSPGVDWMAGNTAGAPDVVAGSGEEEGDQALLFNDPWTYPASPLEFVEVQDGFALGFDPGFLFQAQVRFDAPFSKSILVLGSRLKGALNEQNQWRVAIDTVVGEGYNLTLVLWNASGHRRILKHPIGPDYVGRWIHVAAGFDAQSGLASLYWDDRRVAVLDLSGQTLRSGPATIRIAAGSDATPTSAFQGSMDAVRIWGARPGCYRLSTVVEPAGAGSIQISPAGSQVPDFCQGNGYFTTGERVQLQATPDAGYAFYEWGPGLNYLEGSEEQEFRVNVRLNGPATATAEFVGRDWAPVLDYYPIAGPHNTSVDESCTGAPPCDVSCELGCDSLAMEVSNDICHAGAQDLFAPCGTKVVAVIDGFISYYCDSLGGNSAYITDGESGEWEYLYYYGHLDGLCYTGGNYVCSDYPTERPDELDCDALFSNREYVTAGTVIGTVGRSGSAHGTEPHVHFGILERGQGMRCSNWDPYPFLFALEENSCD